ncbi:conserved hypothetical membrane protein (DUF3307) [Formosa agariphila KMM 3901]|uniref:Conserved hypothetical membrane protein (DUF3307) n=1 Tax=Formosa agariphila (strain DSM 15362 / KCTC 12365 / LMG 23005 / KMM 3901 / M-2Alg 35-1) TaxID=1347342 RepID=T2KKR0_FORAG|nr:DUF3307 domain-containing protein [Formosa agariphila]CDF79016.1 conserved hypothetical membrane protein (DUF3307) [Formosa agariphila KMM 3901]
MIVLFIKLLLAHLVGDFLLQPSKWVADKEKHKIKSKYLYAHIAIHFIALLFVLQFSFKYIWGIVILTVSHFIIDAIKLHLNGVVNSRWLFCLDQLAHLTLIAIVVRIYEPFTITIDTIYDPKILLAICCIIFVTVVSSIIMKIIISKWQLEETNEASLKDAGAYIGMLERLFVFTFIVLNYWAGIGFLITAKSVFRFGDLSKAKDRKLTEYILIGTLLSFGLAIGCGLLFNYILPLL